MPQYFNIILTLFDRIHNILDHFVFDTYHQLVLALRLPLALCIALYVVLLGYSVSHGWISLSFSYIVKITLKLSVIYLLAMNWDFFSHYVVDFIQQGSSQLAGILLTSNKNIGAFVTDRGIEGALQSVLTHFTKVGYWLWRQGSWHNFSPCFEAIVIWGSGLTLVLYALLQLIIANIMLSILFTLAPLFISFLIFEKTQSLFDRWAGHVLSYALLTLFVSLLLSLILNIAEWSISDITENNLLTTLLIASFVPIVIVCFVSVALIKRISAMAYDIGLSFSTVYIKRFIHEKSH